MAPKKKNDSKCIKCNLLLRKIAGTKKMIKTEEDAKEFTEKIKKTIIIGDVLCGKCFLKYNDNAHNKKDKGEGNEDNSSKENNESGKNSCNSSAKTDSFDWQDSSSPNEASDDPDFELSADEPVDEDSDEGPTNAKRRKKHKFNYALNSLDSSKNMLQNALADLESKSNEITKSSNSSFGCSSLVNNLSFDYEPKQKVLTEKEKSMRCFLCGEKTDLMDIPREARKQYFTQKYIVIADNAKCCIKHFNNDRRTFIDEVVAIKTFVKPLVNTTL